METASQSVFHASADRVPGNVWRQEQRHIDIALRPIVPVDAGAEQQLKKRTLTNLYNARPTWLANAHRKLDEAVFTAYGWSPSMADDELLATLLDLNLARSAAETPASAAGRQS